MVRRTNVWRFFYRRYGDLAVDANLDRCLHDLVTYRRIAKLEPDAERLRREFTDGGPRTYGRLFSLLHTQLAERDGKPRWGEKSLHTEHHAAEVFTEFPDARIVHMLRDPRDRYSSAIKRHGRDVHRVAAATGRWLLSTRAGLRDAQRWPGRYMILRYEDLASEPEATMREVCAFFGEDFEPEMLRMGAEPEHRDAGGNSSFGDIEPGMISTRGIGRYRSGLSAMEWRFVEAMAGPLMAALGYEPDHPSVREEWLRYYGWFLPVNAVRMVAWMTYARVRIRRGRDVPPNPEPAADAAARRSGGGRWGLTCRRTRPRSTRRRSSRTAPRWGTGRRIWHRAHVRAGSRIGARCSVGFAVYVDTEVVIGDGCKIQNHVSLYRGVTLQDDVFVGPSAVFTNDLHPRAASETWTVVPTRCAPARASGRTRRSCAAMEIGADAMVARRRRGDGRRPGARARDGLAGAAARLGVRVRAHARGRGRRDAARVSRVRPANRGDRRRSIPISAPQLGPRRRSSSWRCCGRAGSCRARWSSGSSTPCAR